MDFKFVGLFPEMGAREAANMEAKRASALQAIRPAKGPKIPQTATSGESQVKASPPRDPAKGSRALAGNVVSQGGRFDDRQ